MTMNYERRQAVNRAGEFQTTFLEDDGEYQGFAIWREENIS